MGQLSVELGDVPDAVDFGHESFDEAEVTQVAAVEEVAELLEAFLAVH